MVYPLRFLPLQNAICFIILTYLVPLLFTFYIHGISSQFFPSSKCNLFHNSNVFGSRIIHIYIHCVSSPFFSLQNAIWFIILTYLVPVLFTVNIQGVLKLKKK